jgi:hypothetical protein
MKLIGPLITIVGFFIIYGTVGASDHDLTMSITQIMLQILAGIVVMGIGIYNMR